MGEIYDRYAPEVYRFLLRMSGNPVLSEDITQTTFLKAIEKIDSFKNQCSLKTWLCQIAKNEYLNMMKKAENRNVPLEEQKKEPIDEAAGVEEQLTQAETAREIRAAVHRLKEPYKEVFLLRAYGELSFREIGEIFGKSEVWGRVTYLRSREKVAEIWKKGM
ncbi:MAG: sigma-70 family RNA polymerase sigma factor [Clostridiales bacterium]|nr:sigma-70 family RNA polymerase sigma factor [Clostridiales bacterium]